MFQYLKKKTPSYMNVEIKDITSTTFFVFCFFRFLKIKPSILSQFLELLGSIKVEWKGLIDDE